MFSFVFLCFPLFSFVLSPCLVNNILVCCWFRSHQFPSVFLPGPAFCKVYSDSLRFNPGQPGNWAMNISHYTVLVHKIIYIHMIYIYVHVGCRHTYIYIHSRCNYVFNVKSPWESAWSIRTLFINVYVLVDFGTTRCFKWTWRKLHPCKSRREAVSSSFQWHLRLGAWDGCWIPCGGACRVSDPQCCLCAVNTRIFECSSVQC